MTAVLQTWKVCGLSHFVFGDLRQQQNCFPETWLGLVLGQVTSAQSGLPVLHTDGTGAHVTLK